MSSRENSTVPTPEARAQHLVSVSLYLFAAARGLAMYAAGLPAPPSREELAAMEAKKIPYSLAAALRRDITFAVEHRIDEGLTMLETAAHETPASLCADWRTWQ